MHIILIILSFFHLNCYESNKKIDYRSSIKSPSSQEQNINGKTIKERFITPIGYERSHEENNSFQEYLRNLKLKPHGSLVEYYNGSVKSNNDIYEAVIDLKIGEKDLHQCADAVMRLRAEFLWDQKKYNKIKFNFTNGHQVEYLKWMEGNRMNIEENKTWWSKTNQPSNSYEDFWNYMELIFMYAGTASLEKELNSVNITLAKIGDILIQGGHPGHAVIIVDKAINKTTGETIYLLAQSYMPAQEIQVLKNPNNSNLNPWYEFKNERITTPEWEFLDINLKRFKN